MASTCDTCVIAAATFTEGGSGGSPNTLIVSDSKTNLKEAATSGGIPTTTSSTLGPPSLSVGNHLDIPQNNNPHFLSPDVLSQRRGNELIYEVINLRNRQRVTHT